MATVLVIEDDPVIRYVLTDLLSEEGMSVIEAGDIGTARQLLQTQQPDIITLDLNLAGVQGGVLLQEVRSHPRLSKVPVIVISGYEAELLDIRGADAVITKPFDIAQVAEAVHQLCDGNST